MKVTTNYKNNIQLEEVFNPVILKTSSGEELCICMRDSGFEFTYEGKKYSAQKGVIEEVESNLGLQGLIEGKRKRNKMDIPSMQRTIGNIDPKKFENGYIIDDNSDIVE